MTNKINGVDVAECGFYHPEIDNYCHIALAFAEDYVDDDHTYLECKQNPNCYFKKLQRLKQENEELKKNQCCFATCEHINAEIARYAKAGEALIKYMQALELIKTVIKEYESKEWNCFNDMDTKLEKISEILDEVLK